MTTSNTTSQAGLLGESQRFAQLEDAEKFLKQIGGADHE